jgi:hypothetical protein
MSAWYFILALAFLGCASAQSAAQGADWESYRSPRFGYSLLFPADLLRLVSESPDGQNLEFVSADGQTKLRVLTVINSDNVSPREYRAQVIGSLHDYRAIKYGPMGGSWFVLSGVRGPNIFYQKVVFACGGRIINAFAMTYPSAEKRGFDPIVTTIEKNFRASSECAANR